MSNLNYKNIFDTFFHSYLKHSSINEELHLHARIHYIYGGENWLGEHQKFYTNDNDIRSDLTSELIQSLQFLSQHLNISSQDLEQHSIQLTNHHHHKSYSNTLEFYEYYGNSSTHGVFSIHFLDIGKQLLSDEQFLIYQESFNEYLLKKNKPKKNFKY